MTMMRGPTHIKENITKLYGLHSCYTAQGSHWNDICEDETEVQGMEVERRRKETLEKQEWWNRKREKPKMKRQFLKLHPSPHTSRQKWVVWPSDRGKILLYYPFSWEDLRKGVILQNISAYRTTWRQCQLLRPYSDKNLFRPRSESNLSVWHLALSVTQTIQHEKILLNTRVTECRI